jgi:hypothetical protein
MAEDRFDGMFLTVANQANGIEPLLESMFSFLRRKTDFFSGASQDKIESLVLSTLRKQAALAERDVAEKKAAAAKEEKKRQEKLDKKRKVKKSGFSRSRLIRMLLGGRGCCKSCCEGCSTCRRARRRHS